MLDSSVHRTGHLSIIQNYKGCISNVKEETMDGWTNASFSRKGAIKESHYDSYCNILKKSK